MHHIITLGAPLKLQSLHHFDYFAYPTSLDYAALGKELGIPGSSLACWVNSGKYRAGSGKRKVTAVELAELKVLRKELIRVRMERDILKKAVAIFAKPKKGTGSNS